MIEMKTVLVYVVPAVLAVIVAYVGARTNRSGSRENALIDQLQEQLATERGEREKLSTKVDAMAVQLQSLVSRDGLWHVHAIRVEAQVTDLGGTPHQRPALLRID